MRLVSFDAFRTLSLSQRLPVQQIKADHFLRYRNEITQADWVLFPQTWQLNVLSYAWKKHVFPSPVSYDIGYDKIEQTRAFQALVPQHVPLTLILSTSESGQEEALDILGLPLVVKEPRNSMGRGVRLIETRSELRTWCEQHAVLYAQEWLSLSAEDERSGNGDLRIVWVGARVISAYWRRGGTGFLHNLSQGGYADFSGIPEPALTLVAQVATELGVDHAGFDVAWVSGHPYLLEMNVLFGHDGLQQQGIDLGAVIADWLLRPARAESQLSPASMPTSSFLTSAGASSAYV